MPGLGPIPWQGYPKLPFRPGQGIPLPCGSCCWQRGGPSWSDEPETDPGDTILRLDSPGGTAQGQLVKLPAGGLLADSHGVLGASGRVWSGSRSAATFPTTRL